MHKLFIITIIFLAFIPYAQASSWNKLRSPYPVFDTLPNNISISGNLDQCPKTPPSIHDMEYTSIYTNRGNGLSIIDPAAKKKYRKQITKLKKFEIQIHRWVEAAFTSNQEEKKSINCAIKWLSDWAEKKSMLGGKTTFQGEAMRKWTLASLSAHYLQIKDLTGIDKKQKRSIDKWLQKLGKQVISDYNKNPESMSRNNNHMYWAAWSVMITGVALNDKSFYRWSETQLKKALRQIQEDGTLTNELYREGKAFNYHLFATAPLVMMTETMTHNGKNMYNYNGKALQKLVSRMMIELETDQDYIEDLTLIQQDLEGTITSGQLAWMEVYYKRFKDDRMTPWLNDLRPMVQRRIGGNMTRLFAQNIKDNDKY